MDFGVSLVLENRRRLHIVEHVVPKCRCICSSCSGCCSRNDVFAVYSQTFMAINTDGSFNILLSFLPLGTRKQSYIHTNKPVHSTNNNSHYNLFILICLSFPARRGWTTLKATTTDPPSQLQQGGQEVKVWGASFLSTRVIICK